MAYRLVSTSNPKVGRHAIGSSTGKPLPNRKSQGASGNFVGTGVNRKSAAHPEYGASASASNNDYKGQIERFIDQSPAPFRNPQPGARPMANTTGVMRDLSTLTSAPGKHPVRKQGRSVMAQSGINLATGYAAGYKPAGQAGNPIISGQPVAGKGAKNKDNAGQGPAKAPKFKTNLDIFGPGLDAYKRHGG
jgi:hypothetical protein